MTIIPQNPNSEDLDPRQPATSLCLETKELEALDASSHKVLDGTNMAKQSRREQGELATEMSELSKTKGTFITSCSMSRRIPNCMPQLTR